MPPGILLGTVTSHIIPLQIKTFGKGHIAWDITAPSLTEAFVALAYQRQYAFSSFKRLEKILASKK